LKWDFFTIMPTATVSFFSSLKVLFQLGRQYSSFFVVFSGGTIFKGPMSLRARPTKKLEYCLPSWNSTLSEGKKRHSGCRHYREKISFQDFVRVFRSQFVLNFITTIALLLFLILILDVQYIIPLIVLFL